MLDMLLLILYILNLLKNFIWNLVEEDGINLIVKKYVNLHMLEFKELIH